MTQDLEREEWNRRFRDRERVAGPEPSPFLVESLSTVLDGTPGRRALDVACGEGRNSIYLARNGFRTLGVDNSDVALDTARRLSQSAGLDIDFRLLNLRDEVPEGVFDFVVMVKFLLKPLIPRLYELTAPGGFLLMEVTLDVSDGGPTRHNPEFMVASGELERLMSGFAGRVVVSSDHPESEKARILFRKG